MGKQYDKQHSTTVLATAALLANRLVGFGGDYASGAAGAGGATDACGVSESSAAIGEAVSVITGYSAVVTAGAAISAGAFIKPGTSGKAVTGSITDNCGRALEAAGADGDLLEVRLQNHIHPTT